MSEPLPPQANPRLFGHARAESVLLRALTSGRLPHAWLLRGPRGVGKATLAYRFARRLLAGDEHERAATDPDPSRVPHGGEEGPSRPAGAGAHRQPEDRQALQGHPGRSGARWPTRRSTPPPARAGRKVLIIDPADELNTSGANALLKLLEEPPASVVLLLVCQRPGLLPRDDPLALRPAAR